jgi:anthranilate phosphoribosyltransferase
MIQETIGKLTEKENLTSEEVQQAMQEIMSGTATSAQMAAFLTALAVKGESKNEILGSALVMRQKSVKVPHHQEQIVDCCGTGGDCSNTFNVSTLVAFILAAAGLPVAKHGNRSVTSKCGSADLLQAAGAKIELTPVQVAKCIDEIGIGFVFAPLFHPAMKNVAPVRKELGIRTIFNILGPLSNPAGATHQIIGVFDQNLTEIIAQVCSELGITRSWAVHCLSKIDELTPCERNKISCQEGGTVQSFFLNPEELGFTKADKSELVGGDGRDNLKIAQQVLRGEKGAPRDTAVLNAAAGLVVAEKVSDLKEGITLAEEMIDSGEALRKTEELVRLSNKC